MKNILRSLRPYAGRLALLTLALACLAAVTVQDGLLTVRRVTPRPGIGTNVWQVENTNAVPVLYVRSNGLAEISTDLNVFGSVSGGAFYDFSMLNGASVVVSDPLGFRLLESSVTTTELGYLSGVTGGIQTNLDARASIASVTLTSNGLQAQLDSKVSAGSNTIADYARFSLLRSNNSPWRLGSFGDSLGDDVMNAWLGDIARGIGFNGGYLTTITNTTVYPLTFTHSGNVTVAGASTNWWANHFILRDTAAVTFDSGGQTVVANTFRAAVVHSTNGGTYKIQVQTNGGAFTDVTATLNALSAYPTGVVTTFSTNTGDWKLRVLNVTGTNVLIGGGAWSSNAGGASPSMLSLTGTTMSDITAVVTNISAPVLSSLGLSEIHWHAFDTPSDITNSLPTFCNLLAMAAPAADVAFIGANQVTDNALRYDLGNRYIQDFVTARGYAFVDTGQFGTTNQLVNRGFVSTGDCVHLSENGQRYLAEFMWQRNFGAAKALNLRVSSSLGSQVALRIYPPASLTTNLIEATSFAGSNVFTVNGYGQVSIGELGTNRQTATLTVAGDNVLNVLSVGTTNRPGLLTLDTNGGMTVVNFGGITNLAVTKDGVVAFGGPPFQAFTYQASNSSTMNVLFQNQIGTGGKVRLNLGSRNGFNGDTNIGVSFLSHRSDTSAGGDTDLRVSLSNGSTPKERMALMYSGRMGIGTNAPSARLHVTAENAGELVFQAGTTNKPSLLTLDTNGNVGIGTASPSVPLHVVGGSIYIDNSSAGTALLRLSNSLAVSPMTISAGIGGYINSGLAISGTAGTYFNIIEMNSAAGNLNGVVIGHRDNSSHIAGVGGTALLVTNGQGQASSLVVSTTNSPYNFVVKRNGTIGIGETNPAAQLHITNNTASIDLLRIYTNGSGATPAFMVRSNGNVGLGIITPTNKLQVTGISMATDGFASYSSNLQAVVLETLPASPSLWTNVTSKNVSIGWRGVAVTGVSINGSEWMTALSGGMAILQPGEYVGFTNTIVPTFTWKPF